MGDERVYSIRSDGGAQPAQLVSLADVGLRERQDLQEWVLAHPEILGPGIKVVTLEFDRWQTSGGDRQLDRLDVLGLDVEGQLVLAELKRDRAPDTVQLQAIKYAAMVSRFTPTDLAAYHQRFLAARSEVVTEEEALEALVEHAGELDLELLRRPRIVVVAGSYSPVTTASVVWLSEMGLDITLQQAQAYRIGSGELVITVSQTFPLADVEDFTISPMQAETRTVREKQRGRRERSTVVRLVDAQTLADGTLLHLRPTSEVLPEARGLIDTWVAEDPSRGLATWSNNRSKPLTWHADGQAYRPTAIVSQILREAADMERSVRGPSWWTTEDGTDLTQLAGRASSSQFDWSTLHDLLAGVPAGSWTTYGDLADVIGTAAQPVGNHVAGCPDCPNAHRVLGRQGEPSAGFRWSDPTRTETQRDALEREGVTFAGDRADPSRRLGSSDLTALVE